MLALSACLSTTRIRMKLLRIVSLTTACVFFISAVTGLQRLHLSTETGVSFGMHTLLTRLITLAFGLLFFLWYFEIRKRFRDGMQLTTIVFAGMTTFCFWQGVGGAIAGGSAFAKIWSLTSQSGLTILLYLIWRNIVRIAKSQQLSNGPGAGVSSH